jgi:glycerophosphoryl diester phosphodiesterase
VPVRAPLAAMVLCLALAAPAAAATPEIHSHRGGPNVDGKAAQPEDAQPAFEFGHSLGTDVVELDAKLSSDNVPFVLHDATLDRTTDCSGEIRDRSAADLAACHVDTIGTESKITQVPGAQVPIPRLADVLAWAKANGVKLNLEIKNQPTDPDYDSTPAFARAILAAVTGSGIPRDHVLIQSFWPPNLDEAKAQGFRTSYLSLAQTNEQAIEFARTRDYDVLSPAWPVSSDPKAYVKRAHDAGLPVVPYTFNEADDVKAAVEAGVDAVIVNDVPAAQRAIYGVDCPTARVNEAKQRSALVRARRSRDRARGAARARAQAKVRAVNARRQAAKRLRLRVCTPGT